MISCIIAVLNGEKTIEKTIQSFLRQTGDKEMLVIDSGTDRTEEICRKYPISYHRVPFVGQFEKINYGIEIMKGDTFVIMGHDDQLIDEAFERVRREKQDWVYGDMLLLDEKGEEIGQEILETYSQERYWQKNIIPIVTSFVRKDCLKGLRFNQSYPINADYDFFLRLSQKIQPRQIHHFLTKYMIRPDSEYRKNIPKANKDREIIRSELKKELCIN